MTNLIENEPPNIAPSNSPNGNQQHRSIIDAMDKNGIAYMALTRDHPTKTVVEAAEITNTSLQNWFHRKLVVGHKGGTGRRLFNFANVMAFSIVKQLADLGLGVQNAFMAANQFSHIAQDMDGCRRLPAFPYAGADESTLFDVTTWLVVSGEQSLSVPQWRDEDVFSKIGGFSPAGGGFILLKINPLFEVVSTRLGYPPRLLMESAYKDKINPQTSA